jgi:hypothetical protein
MLVDAVRAAVAISVASRYLGGRRYLDSSIQTGPDHEPGTDCSAFSRPAQTNPCEKEFLFLLAHIASRANKIGSHSPV